jgi:1,4-dihydroxy-2-naphthoate octaprenyltransferase
MTNRNKWGYQPIPLCDGHFHILFAHPVDTTVKILSDTMTWYDCERIAILGLPQTGEAIADPANATHYSTWGCLRELALISLPVASLVCVIMHGNDMRDIPTDRAAGIRTPATMLEAKGSLVLYCFCHLLPYAVCAWLICRHGRIFLLPFMAFPLTRRTLATAIKVWLANPHSPSWLRLERASGAIHLAFGILYAVAWRTAGGVF